MNKIIEKLQKYPVVAAVFKENDVQYAVNMPIAAIFLMHADILNIKGLVDSIKSSGRSVLIHVDFLEGIAKDNKAIEYIARVIKPDGIISTKSNCIKFAKNNGLLTIQRFFVVDSISYKTTIKEAHNVQPDMIEILPAIMPKIINRIVNEVNMPVIAGGLVENREDIVEVLRAGASGVSTGEKELWNYRELK